MAIEAVTFDFWNTLVFEAVDKRSERTDDWQAMIADAGYDVDRGRLEAAIDAGWHAYNQHWIDNVPFHADDALGVVLDVLGITGADALRASMLAVITDPPEDRHPRLNPNVLTTLSALHENGVRIGIICDVGMTPSRTLRRYLADQGALGYFDHWSFSDEVGVYKPDAKIFRHALAGLGGVDPQRAAHVGDLRRTDIMGANAFGMTSVRYTGVYDDPGMPDSPTIEADHVIADHADLPNVLGLA